MKVKLVTFDVTNTLIRLKEKPGFKYARCASALGIHVDGILLNEAFRSQWTLLNEEHPNYGVSTGMPTSATWWQTLIRRTFSSAGYPFKHRSQLEILSENLIREYRGPQCWEMCPGAGNVAEALSREKRLTVGVISNFDETLEELLGHMGLLTCFQFVISSHNVRCCKPDSRIFEKALAECPGISPREALHVGDDLRRDYLGARNAGWRAILIADNGHDEKKVCKNVEEAYGIIQNRL